MRNRNRHGHQARVLETYRFRFRKVTPVTIDEVVQQNKSRTEPALFSIPDLAERWRCSRATVYNMLRGEEVIDFAPAPGRKGHKLVTLEVVRRIEMRRVRKFR
jgi:hypothetical protein